MGFAEVLDGMLMVAAKGGIWIAMISPQCPTVGAGSSQREDAPARSLPPCPPVAIALPSRAAQFTQFLRGSASQFCAAVCVGPFRCFRFFTTFAANI